MYDEKSEAPNKPVLIVPAAGKSSRFPNMKPKWMLTHTSGMMMIEKVLSGIDLTQYSKVYIGILKEHCRDYHADVVLSQAFSANNLIEVVVIDEPTKSSPHTVYEILLRKKIEGDIVVKDCDSYVEYSLPKSPRFVVGCLVTRDCKIRDLPSKSYIVRGGVGEVVRMVEKTISSDMIGVGVYGMRSPDLVSFIDMVWTTSPTSKELYFSDIVNYYTGKSPFQIVESLEYIDWGTKDQWFSADSSKKTYIFDIDGTVFENTGKYGLHTWYSELTPIKSNLDVIKGLSDSGNEIIFMTSRDYIATQEVHKFLRDYGIKYKAIIDGCMHAKRIIVNDFADTNPYPSCEAVSFPRNNDLSKYLRV